MEDVNALDIVGMLVALLVRQIVSVFGVNSIAHASSGQLNNVGYL